MISAVPPLPERHSPLTTRSRRAATLAEAIGYAGGTLALVGLGIVAGNYWPDMAPAARAAAAGAGTALFLAGGALAGGRSSTLVRLRGFLWFLATAAAGLTAQVLLADIGDVQRDATIALAIATAVVVVSALCWQGDVQRPIQLATLFGGIVAMCGAAMAEVTHTGPTGLVVWSAGALLAVAAWQWERRDSPVLALVAGLAMIAGGVLCADRWTSVGLALGVVGGTALLAAALVPGILDDSYEIAVFAATGVLALWASGPRALVHWSQDAGPVVGSLMWVAGAFGIEIARRRLVRVPRIVEAAGAFSVLLGAGLWSAQWEGVGPILGIVTAALLVAASLRPGLVMLSIYGSLGLLVYVPWAIAYWFPGRGRVPLLVFVAGVLLCGIAVLLARSGSRFGRELGRGGPVSPPVL